MRWKEKRGASSYWEMDGPLTVCSCHRELSDISSGEATEGWIQLLLFHPWLSVRVAINDIQDNRWGHRFPWGIKTTFAILWFISCTSQPEGQMYIILWGSYDSGSSGDRAWLWGQGGEWPGIMFRTCFFFQSCRSRTCLTGWDTQDSLWETARPRSCRKWDLWQLER